MAETFLKMIVNNIGLGKTSAPSLKKLPGVTLHKQKENIGDHMERGGSHK